jgi:hypothetical protein
MLSFKEQIKRQTNFLIRSCELFDQGHYDEAIRIATTIRVLVHDTKQSTSLLTHLNAKSIKLCSTIGDADLSNVNLVFSTCGLYYVMILPGGKSIFKPTCHLKPQAKYKAIDVEDWVNQIILKNGEVATRKDIFLGAANTDGGAHVDSKPKKIYEKLAYGGGLGFTQKAVDGEIQEIPIENVQLVIFRQMAHEILISEEYQKLYL